MESFCVCGEPLEDRSLYPCGHALCPSCTLKRRVLMKELQCPYCRSPAKFVCVVSAKTTDPFAARTDFQPGALRVESKELERKLRHILSHPCPLCDEEHKNYHGLKTHIQKEHNKALCDVCTRQEYNFSDEYELLEPKAMKDHLRKRHVWCKYCHIYFYGNTEFSAHCKKEHMGCAICERRDPEHPYYCKDYDQLYEHYKEKHYMCMVPSCLEDKHIVFGTALELQKHMLQVHKGLMSNSRHGNQVDLDLVNRDAVEAQSSTARDSPANNVGDEKVRYEARLDILSNHEKSKIDMIHEANKTLLHKNGTVENFIFIHEALFRTAKSDEITALFIAFKRAFQSSLSEETSRILGFQINLRSRTEQKPEKETGLSRLKTASDLNVADQSSHPSPSRVSKINWGYTVPSATGLGNMSNLPKLGSRNLPKLGSRVSGGNPSNSSSSHAVWSARKTATPPISGIKNLPTLAKKVNPYQQDDLSVRQTSVPSRQKPSSSSRPAYMHEAHNAGASSFYSSLNSRSASTPASGSASQTSLASSSSVPARGISTANLPKLPQQQKPEEKKKRQRNVLRIV